MDEKEFLTGSFEEHRDRLRAMAYRMLGSTSEADDAIQEAWLRLNRTGATTVDNLGGWLTTVVARVCLNMLQSRSSRREQPLGPEAQTAAVNRREGSDPEHEVLVADSVGLALLVVLDQLSPAERLAFVLHDMFAVPFDEIAPIVERSPAATRQLASRARRRVQGAPTVRDADLVRRREIVNAFVAASRNGDFDALLALLDPDVVIRADEAAIRLGAQSEVRGAAAAAEVFLGRARRQAGACQRGPGAGVAPRAQPRVVLDFNISNDKIVAIVLIADGDQLRKLDITILEK